MAKTKKKTNSLDGSLFSKIAKIDSLPKTVQDSIPFRGIMQDGIIETKPGVFTKTYKLEDANFTMLNEDEQISFMKKFMNILNTFPDGCKWQFNIYNHEIDKRKTLEDICIKPQGDNLNKYRKEMNEILTSNLKHGNASLTQDKYLTVSIEDGNVEHGISTLDKMDVDISKRFRSLSARETRPLSLEERLRLIYNIYNQSYDYRLATGVFDGEEHLDLSLIAKQGLSVKDIIGPSSMQFSDNTFMLGDRYGQAFYLERVPMYLSTDFLRDICDIQTNSLISMNFEQIDADVANNLVKSQLATIEARIDAVTKKHNDDGSYNAALPPELEKSQIAARDLMNDITSRDQRLYYMTFTVCLFATSKENLSSVVKILNSIAAKHQCPIKPLKFQQEQALNTTLPFCRNELSVERLYTTESASAFIPYNTIELNQKHAVFYGLNQVSKSMIMYDRTKGDNFNGLIFGSSGSGKSFAAKNEMINVLLSHPEAQIFVIDPQGEYTPLVKALNGTKIPLAPGARTYVNPMDLDISDVEDENSNPIAGKIDFITSMISTIKKAPLTSSEEAIINAAVTRLYDPYVRELERDGKTIDKDRCPTLSDLYQLLDIQRKSNPEAGNLCDILSSFTMGQFDNFAHRTNVKTDNRFVVYDIKGAGTKMKELSYQVCLNDIWNRMIENSKKGIYTWIYIDEFHILLESEEATLTLKRIWKMARKWLGVPTGIMQNAADLLKSSETQAIFNNTSFILMLKGQLMDRNAFQELLHLSPAQLEYITDSDRGYGLFYNGKMTIPFKSEFPTKTKLYSIMTTQHDGEAV
ncbi:VirB4-like conjugal transfer ATPase, CD1110 family [Lachnospira multipara]|uniref:Type IV secretory pathway, VirB4 component n=1 Tax=Lachnospira multipara TaxID=28051 RepID=A0A1H5WVR4_9FIRM|nr:DUF87 domain-containing protein [Lachnospira multipara]SEG03612.1 Type IV secretory pathway, VirB4 component [Lachnospira multipara]